MPIASLTRGASFPEIGQIRKGGVKPETGNRPGVDLDYFRFTSTDEEAVRLWHEAFGEKPRAINVFLPLPTLDDNFESWQEAYTAGAIQHRCDGVECVGWRTSKGEWSNEPQSCPGGCKPVGRLKVFIPAFRRMALVTVLTTSKHDIISLQSSLFALQLVKGDLQGIPLVLRRVEREISTPNDKGGRTRRKKWLLQIEAEPQWAALQFGAMREAALLSAGREPLLLESGMDDEDESEPEAITVEAERVHDPAPIAQQKKFAPPELVSKIRELWPKYGTRRQGMLLPMERILKENKWSLDTWPMDRAEATYKHLLEKEAAAKAERESLEKHDAETDLLGEVI